MSVLSLSDEMVAFRKYYESLTPEERQEARRWLYKAKGLTFERKLTMFLRVHVEILEVNDMGQATDIRMVDYTPGVLLNAIEAWEREAFTPTRARP